MKVELSYIKTNGYDLVMCNNLDLPLNDANKISYLMEEKYFPLYASENEIIKFLSSIEDISMFRPLTLQEHINLMWSSETKSLLSMVKVI